MPLSIFLNRMDKQKDNQQVIGKKLLISELFCGLLSQTAFLSFVKMIKHNYITVVICCLLMMYPPVKSYYN